MSAEVLILEPILGNGKIFSDDIEIGVSFEIANSEGCLGIKHGDLATRVCSTGWCQCGASEGNIFISLLIGGVGTAACYDLFVIDDKPFEDCLGDLGVFQI